MYQKILVARRSDENKCFVDDGIPLTVVPLAGELLLRDRAHHFVSAKDGRTPSKYGWVKSVDPIELGDFSSRYLGREFSGADERGHVQIMLRSIAALIVDTPVACGYVVRGVESRALEFQVHRVFFFAKNLK